MNEKNKIYEISTVWQSAKYVILSMEHFFKNLFTF